MNIITILLMILLSFSLPYAMVLDTMHRQNRRNNRQRNKYGEYTTKHTAVLKQSKNVRLIKINTMYGETRYIIAR